MKQILTLSFLFILNVAAQAQDNAFYLKYENDAKHEFANSYIPFATEIGTDQYVYLRNYHIYDHYGQGRILLGYENFLVLSDNKGNIQQEILISDGLLTNGPLIGFRINDHLVLTGFAYKDSFSYLVTHTFDLNLNETEKNSFLIGPKPLYSGIDFPVANVLDGKLYISITDSPVQGAINLRFDGNGKLEVWKNTLEFGALDLTGFTMSVDKSQLIFVNDSRPPNAFYYDLEFNYIRKKQIYETHETIPLDLGWFSNYLLLDSSYLAFGRSLVEYQDINSFGKFTGELDTNFHIKNITHLDSTSENGYTDGPPRFTSGIFKGSDGYYTCYDITTGENNPFYSTLIVTKYNFDFELLWDRRLIIDDNKKFFNLYAELLPDNSFIISGYAIDKYKEVFSEDNLIGHIIKLNPDGSPPILSNYRNSETASFSIIENPVGSNFEIMKSKSSNENISVQILDINGKLLKQSKDWQSDRLNIQVNRFLPGTYFYSIVDGYRIIYSGKFIKI